MTCLVKAQSPALSASFFSEDILQLSWPSNFTAANWQLEYSTNDQPSLIWQPLPMTPIPLNDALAVHMPIGNSKSYFRLQKLGAGSCVFQATPPVINSGGSSTLTWCPLAGYSYRMLPGPGPAPGGSLTVSPTNTTVYSLIASNASGFVLTNNVTVIVNPCGWLQVTNLIVEVGISYDFSTSTPSYNFSVFHVASVTFHLVRQAGGSTDTDAYFFGYATAEPIYGVVLDKGLIKDIEDDKTGPSVFTTTEMSGRIPVRLDASVLSLHVTCTTYDFTYNILVDQTEVTSFGTYNFPDGVGSGSIVTRALPAAGNSVSDYVSIPAQYPPNNGDYFIPSSDVGKQMFTSGTVTAPNAGEAFIDWHFYPQP